MTLLSRSPAWQALVRHADAIRATHLRELFSDNPNRFNELSMQVEGVLVDYSKQRITNDTVSLLCDLARSVELEAARDAMFAGDPINVTENRAVLHTALRDQGSDPLEIDGQDVRSVVTHTLAAMRACVSDVHEKRWRGYSGKPIRHVVNLGIGGSDLGPAMVYRALPSFHRSDITVHFVANVDGADIQPVLSTLDPDETLFLIASKSFTTDETMTNARTARAWLLKKAGDEAAVAKHFIALSTNRAATAEFGISQANVFEFWDFVGGRYSLWSAIGLSLALGIGFAQFEALLAGAHAMDRHFKKAPLRQNLPVILGLISVWNRNFLGATSQAIIPYDQNLSRLPAHLQQLEMESNGKHVDRKGQAVDYSTSPVLWGEPGTNSQHAFFQLLHQGTDLIPIDFLVAARPEHDLNDHHEKLLANCLAQSNAFAFGKTATEVRAEMADNGHASAQIDALAPHKVFPGNRPSTTLVYPRLDPRTLGALVALYEHQTFVKGAIWNINSFDQWGVELGKQLAKSILPAIVQPSTTAKFDSSTNGLLDFLNQHR